MEEQLHAKHQGACLPSMHASSARCFMAVRHWTTYMSQERRLNTFHMCCLRRILDIKWQENSTQQRHSHAYWGPFYVLSPEPAAPKVAWPCAAHGGRPHSQRRPLRSAGIRQPASGATSPPLQRQVKVRHEGMQVRRRHLGGCCG